MMLRLKGRKGVAIVILGGAHDLSDNVPDGMKLIELTVKAYRVATGESDTSM